MNFRVSLVGDIFSIWQGRTQTRQNSSWEHSHSFSQASSILPLQNPDGRILLSVLENKATETTQIIQVAHARCMTTAINPFFCGCYCCSVIRASISAAHLITGALPIGLNGCLSLC